MCIDPPLPLAHPPRLPIYIHTVSSHLNIIFITSFYRTKIHSKRKIKSPNQAIMPTYVHSVTIVFALLLDYKTV